MPHNLARLAVFTSLILVGQASGQTHRCGETTKCVNCKPSDCCQQKRCCADGGCDFWGSDIWEQEQLTGDWHGIRSTLQEEGLVVADLQLTQFYQAVFSGGREQRDAYGGKMDYVFTVAKGLCVIHAETRYGQDSILDAAGLAPTNANMLYPSLENDTAITGLLFNLPLTGDQDWIASVGKFNTLDLFAQLYPQTGRGVNGFMNGSVFLPLSVVRTVPLSFMGASVMKLKEGQVQGAFAVYDSQNVPTTSGFDDLFENGANVLGLWRFFSNVGGLPGSHTFLGTYATGDFTSLDQTGWSFVPGTGIVPGESTGSWAAAYILEQQLWFDDRNKNRQIGLMSQWGLADPETSQYAWTCNVSLQASGLLPGRTQDSLGLGYFYSGLSNDFKELVNPPLRLQNLQGVEAYYNAAITPWFHLTTDVQFIEPGLARNDTAVVLGMRGNLRF